MPKQPTIVSISSGYASNTQLNGNFEALQTAFDNTISRDGSVPNTMEANFDLNGNDILNAGTVSADNIFLNGTDLSSLEVAAGNAAASATASASSAAAASGSAAAAAASASAAQAVEDQLPDWQGSWVTTTPYETGDLVKSSGNVYICLINHTSGTFTTDLTALKWELFVPKGDSGAGTGDMLNSENLSGLTDKPLALTTIGGQPVDAALTSISGLTTSADKMIYTTASDTYAVTSLTSAARGLLDDATVAGMRSTLAVGDNFGNVPTQITDWNVASSGFFWGDAAAANSPGAFVSAGFTAWIGSSTAVQFAVRSGGNEMYYRRLSVSVWTSWVRIVDLDNALGGNQTWQAPSRSANTTYQNTSGAPIQLIVVSTSGATYAVKLEVSPDNSVWTELGIRPSASWASGSSIASGSIIPNNYYYKITITGAVPGLSWRELR